MHLFRGTFFKMSTCPFEERSVFQICCQYLSVSGHHLFDIVQYFFRFVTIRYFASSRFSPSPIIIEMKLCRTSSTTTPPPCPSKKDTMTQSVGCAPECGNLFKKQLHSLCFLLTRYDPNEPTVDAIMELLLMLRLRKI